MHPITPFQFYIWQTFGSRKNTRADLEGVESLINRICLFFFSDLLLNASP